MVKDLTNNNKISEWVLGPTTHPLDIDIIYSFKNNNFADAIYLCCIKKYTYFKELNIVLMVKDSRSIINSLINYKIIEEFVLDEEERKKLSIIKKININSIFNLRTYRLTSEAKAILQHPYVYNLLINNCNNKLNKYVEYIEYTYNQHLKQIEYKKQEEKDSFILRYKIAKQKEDKYKTANDWAIIGMVEKHNC
jgi:hypothetical protein